LLKVQAKNNEITGLLINNQYHFFTVLKPTLQI